MNNEKLRIGIELRNDIRDVISEIKILQAVNYDNRGTIFNLCSYYISEPLFNKFKNRLINDMRQKLVELQNEFQDL